MEHVTIPENIEGRIPDRMFEGCTSLEKVELHEKLGQSVNVHFSAVVLWISL